MNWISRAKLVFNIPKPENFTDFEHCDECFEHNLTLKSIDIDTVNLEKFGNEGWDPLAFANVAGLLYLMPAFIRFVLENIKKTPHPFLDRFFALLILDGVDNRLFLGCNYHQRRFITEFLEFLIVEYTKEVNSPVYPSFNILRGYEIWYVKVE